MRVSVSVFSPVMVVNKTKTLIISCSKNQKARMAPDGFADSTPKPFDLNFERTPPEKRDGRYKDGSPKTHRYPDRLTSMQVSACSEKAVGVTDIAE
jgi:hypothetical protein